MSVRQSFYPNVRQLFLMNMEALIQDVLATTKGEGVKICNVPPSQN